MYVLKPPHSKGNFVDNLQKTVRTLKEKCGYVPKTAFKRPISSISLKRVSFVPADIELDMDMEIEADEVVMLEEPEGRFL